MITILQGESVAWQGHLLDDEGQKVLDIRDYMIHIVLTTTNEKPLYEWDNLNIVFDDEGNFAIRLTSEATSDMIPGTYNMQATLSLDGESFVFAKTKNVIKVRPSKKGD